MLKLGAKHVEFCYICHTVSGDLAPGVTRIRSVIMPTVKGKLAHQGEDFTLKVRIPGAKNLYMEEISNTYLMYHLV